MLDNEKSSNEQIKRILNCICLKSSKKRGKRLAQKKGVLSGLRVWHQVTLAGTNGKGPGHEHGITT